VAAELDGNPIAGLLTDVFGNEMTVAISTCAVRGQQQPAADLVVSQSAPGTVIRCRGRGSILHGVYPGAGHDLY
jgi:hypothetical protein